MRRTAAVLALLFAAYLYVDLYVLKTARVQRGLAARLERAFGRPVEVSSFELRLLDGPRLVANYVTVAESPRFGYEPFLRAERVSAAVDASSSIHCASRGPASIWCATRQAAGTSPTGWAAGPAPPPHCR